MVRPVYILTNSVQGFTFSFHPGQHLLSLSLGTAILTVMKLYLTMVLMFIFQIIIKTDFFFICQIAIYM